MTSPRYQDADLYRLARTLDLDVDAVEPGDCACRAEAYREASRQGRVQYGQVWPEGDPGRCRRPYTFADGAIRLSCTNGDRVADYLADEGYSGGALDLELMERLDRAAARERKTDPQGAAA